MWVSKIVFMVAGFIWFLPLVLPDNLWPLCRWPQSRKQSHFIRSQWSFVYLRNVRYTHPWSQSQTETKLFLLLFFFSFPDCAPFVAGHLSKHSVISQWTPDHSTQVDIRSRPPPPSPSFLFRLSIVVHSTNDDEGCQRWAQRRVCMVNRTEG